MVCTWVAAERTQKRKHVSLGQNKEPGGKEGECKVKICADGKGWSVEWQILTGGVRHCT